MKKKIDPSRVLAQSIYHALQEGKVSKPVVLNVGEKTSFADYLIVGSATSDRQNLALADRVIDQLKKELGRRPLSVEGRETASWILMDYGEVVVHLFLQETRDFYQLEEMWHDAKRVRFLKKTSEK